MRVVVEASAAFDQTAGIGRYSRNILAAVMQMRPGWDWRLAHVPATSSPAIPASTWMSSSAARVDRIPMSRRRADQLWFRARVPLDLQLFAGRADVLYSPDFTAPPAIWVPRIITVHDLAFLTHPDKTTRALRSYLGAVVPREVKRADAVAVVSEATRGEVVDLLGVPEDKVIVIRNGIEERFFDPPTLTDQDRETLRLPDRFLLMVGTIEPRKNHLNVLRALGTMPPGDRLPLVIAGRPGWGHEQTLALAREMEADGLVRVLQYVSESVLPSLYASADAVLYPSWTEGFGLPVLEAFAAGSPVITGTAPALREVASGLATFVDPGDPDAIASAIAAHVAEKHMAGSPAERIRHARTFTWAEPARRLAELLSELGRRA